MAQLDVWCTSFALAPLGGALIGLALELAAREQVLKESRPIILVGVGVASVKE